MTVYAWVKNEVVNLGSYVGITNAMRMHTADCLLVDTGEPTDTPQWRYGKFREGIQWSAVPLTEYPKEFLTHLLLLGVPV